MVEVEAIKERVGFRIDFNELVNLGLLSVVIIQYRWSRPEVPKHRVVTHYRPWNKGMDMVSNNTQVGCGI